MADAGCSYYYESGEERVQEVGDESTYENIERHQTAPDPQPSTTKNKPRSLVFASVIAASLLVLSGLAIAGIILVSQEKLRFDQAKEMYDNNAAELRGQDRKLNDSLLEKLETEVKDLRAQNRKLNDSLLERLELEVKESHVLQGMIQNHIKQSNQAASKQNQTFLDIQRQMQSNVMKHNKTRMELLKGAESCAELRDKYGISESGIYRVKQKGSYYPAYSYCDFQLRTGINTCGDLLKELGVKFAPGYYWVRDSDNAQPQFKLCSAAPSSCKELVQAGWSSGRIASVYPIPGIAVSKEIYCDSNGWTVFQRRKNGSVDFYRGWDDYVNGFGDMNGEFWLGLETIHQLTKQGNYELRVDLEDFYGNKVYAQYGHFSISSASDKYRLTASSYSGNAKDSLGHHDGMQFTTKDNDNDDNADGNCAVSHKGGWWYKICHATNLNGKYHSSVGTGTDGVIWFYWKNSYQYLKFAEMKFKKKK